jgi:2,4-dienoyl-CoA reductase-like NADH-dependent reductase (Old Yellow Enzyme family)
VTILLDVINRRVPLIGAGSISSNTDIIEALDLGYSLVALGMIALSDKDAVQKLKNNESPSKVISKESLLPPPLFKRIKDWKGIESKGFRVK